MKILLITEQRDAKWNKTSFETLAAAQQIAQGYGRNLSGVVIGKGVAALADELAAKILRKFCWSSTNCCALTRPTDTRSRCASDSAGKARSRFAAAHLSGARFRAQARCISGQGHDRRLHRRTATKTAGSFSCARCFKAKRPPMLLSRGRSVVRNVSGGSVSRRSRCCASGRQSAGEVSRSNYRPTQIRTKPLEMFREAKQAVD